MSLWFISPCTLGSYKDHVMQWDPQTNYEDLWESAISRKTLDRTDYSLLVAPFAPGFESAPLVHQGDTGSRIHNIWGVDVHGSTQKHLTFIANTSNPLPVRQVSFNNGPAPPPAFIERPTRLNAEQWIASFDAGSAVAIAHQPPSASPSRIQTAAEHGQTMQSLMEWFQSPPDISPQRTTSVVNANRLDKEAWFATFRSLGIEPPSPSPSLPSSSSQASPTTTMITVDKPHAISPDVPTYTPSSDLYIPSSEFTAYSALKEAYDEATTLEALVSADQDCSIDDWMEL